MWNGYSIDIYGNHSLLDTFRDELATSHIWHNYTFYESENKTVTNIAVYLTDCEVAESDLPEVNANVKLIIRLHNSKSLEKSLHEIERSSEWREFLVYQWNHRAFAFVITSANMPRLISVEST